MYSRVKVGSKHIYAGGVKIQSTSPFKILEKPMATANKFHMNTKRNIISLGIGVWKITAQIQRAVIN